MKAIGSAAEAVDLETGREQAKDELRLWLRLLTCTNLIESEIRSRLRRRFAMTLPQFDFLAQLYRGPEEGLGMGALGDLMMVSKGNVTGLTDRLERDGFVARVRSAADRRSQFVRLTAKGRKRFEAMAAEHERWITELFTDLPREDEQRLFDLLARLKASVSHAGRRSNGAAG